MGRQFQQFEKAARVWLQRFGLTDWHVEIKHGKPDGSRNASVSFNDDNRKALIEWHGYPPEGAKISPRDTALHEVIHVLLADLVATSARRGDQHPDLIREEHKLIERLIPVLTGKR